MLPRLDAKTRVPSGAKAGSKLWINSPLIGSGAPPDFRRSRVDGRLERAGRPVSVHDEDPVRFVGELRAANATFLPSHDTMGRLTSALVAVSPQPASRLLSPPLVLTAPAASIEAPIQRRSAPGRVGLPVLHRLGLGERRALDVDDALERHRVLHALRALLGDPRHDHAVGRLIVDGTGLRGDQIAGSGVAAKREQRSAAVSHARTLRPGRQVLPDQTARVGIGRLERDLLQRLLVVVAGRGEAEMPSAGRTRTEIVEHRRRVAAEQDAAAFDEHRLHALGEHLEARRPSERWWLRLAAWPSRARPCTRRRRSNRGPNRPGDALLRRPG